MEKRIIQISKFLSVVLSPFYAPLWAFLWLLLFTRLQVLPWVYKAWLLGMVFFFTIFIPRISINLFRYFNHLTHWQLSHREHRHMPYILTLLSYGCCLVLLSQANAWMFFRSIILASLLAQLICVVVNLWWKISTHMVGMGGLVGMTIAFSYTFYFNPLVPLCLLLLLSGLLGTSRMVLRQHSLGQVLTGFAVGFVCVFLCLLFAHNVLVF